MTFSDLLNPAVARLGGRRAVRTRLARRGAKTTRQAIDAWCRGESVPRGRRLLAVLDVVGVRGTPAEVDWLLAAVQHDRA